jgi:hypothetical protein
MLSDPGTYSPKLMLELVSLMTTAISRPQPQRLSRRCFPVLLISGEEVDVEYVCILVDCLMFT